MRPSPRTGRLGVDRKVAMSLIDDGVHMSERPAR